jgi:hypothetical protein
VREGPHVRVITNEEGVRLLRVASREPGKAEQIPTATRKADGISQ